MIRSVSISFPRTGTAVPTTWEMAGRDIVGRSDKAFLCFGQACDRVEMLLLSDFLGLFFLEESREVGAAIAVGARLR